MSLPSVPISGDQTAPAAGVAICTLPALVAGFHRLRISTIRQGTDDSLYTNMQVTLNGTPYAILPSSYNVWWNGTLRVNAAAGDVFAIVARNNAGASSRYVAFLSAEKIPNNGLGSAE